MDIKELTKRYVVFILGLFISSLGVSLVTKAELGTSPISSIPYVLSLGYSPTLGQFTIYFSLFLILLQILILKKDFKKSHLLQIPVSVAFGYFIDATMNMLNWLHPEAYLLKCISLLAGCVILAFGVYLEVVANVVMLPGESFVKAVTIRFDTEFGITKVCFDASMAVVAVISSALMFHTLNGVREGTVVAALIVGLIARFFGEQLSGFSEWLFPFEEKDEEGYIEEIIS